MTRAMRRVAALLAAGGALLGCATLQGEPVQLLGVACEGPPPAHCPEADCPAELMSELGNVNDPATERAFFLDYPCDLRPGEDVTFVLNLHGGGSIANWQRHYFPLMDFKEEHRLVIATPSGTDFAWRPPEDDEHLRNVVTMVEEAVGRENIKAFWLAGHSMGGQTSNRLIMTDPFFGERLTGWVSLSGGRLGSKREDVRAPIPAGVAPPPALAPPAGAGPGAGGGPGLVADASVLPPEPFSFIYETGEHELTAAGLPGGSPWAAELGCGAQSSPREIVDAKAGYVYDTREATTHNPVWGTTPRPGSALVYDYPGCADGRVVADVVRIDKGHTEGLEPEITEEIIRLMMAAG